MASHEPEFYPLDYWQERLPVVVQGQEVEAVVIGFWPGEPEVRPFFNHRTGDLIDPGSPASPPEVEWVLVDPQTNKRLTELETIMTQADAAQVTEALLQGHYSVGGEE